MALAYICVGAGSGSSLDGGGGGGGGERIRPARSAGLGGRELPEAMWRET